LAILKTRDFTKKTGFLHHGRAIFTFAVVGVCLQQHQIQFERLRVSYMLQHKKNVALGINPNLQQSATVLVLREILSRLFFVFEKINGWCSGERKTGCDWSDTDFNFEIPVSGKNIGIFSVLMYGSEKSFVAYWILLISNG
jgi:hypothetical protein